MSSATRLVLLLAVVILAPILPLLFFGDRIDAVVSDWFDPPPSDAALAWATAGLLAADVFLPVPSSLVSTAAAAQLGVLPATFVSWCGMTAGAILAFALARRVGARLARRDSTVDEMAQLAALGRRYGPLLIVVTRALPIVAEAAVLLAGSTLMSRRAFLLAVSLANLGIALTYSIVGSLAVKHGQLPLALAASVALPLAAATMARWRLARAARSASPDYAQSTDSEP